MAGVTFLETTKRFDDVVALDRLDLEIADGEFLVLVGPSGCGKSTALRIIAGLEEVTSGALLIGGVDVTDVEPQDRDLAMVFQSYALYPHKTVRQNIEFPLKSRKVPPDQRRAEAEAAATLLGLGELMERRPGQLSGGQRQRVALARAIVRRPEVFLMDEPLSNLDAKTRVQTRAELSELHESLGATFIYVTHDQVEAMTMGSRIAVMNDGRLQQVGSPDEVYDRPANLFVAGFIGSPPMNTAPARVVLAGDGVSLVVGTGAFALPAGHAAAIRALGAVEVVIGLRPEHLRIGDGPMKATVRAVESLGHERHVVCELAGTDERTDDVVPGTLVIVREDAERPVPRTGEVVGLVAEERHLHLFRADTGERIDP
ncbi:MAG TPA: ABC transporter ATP-binding protein [Acidimicrobiales bacterium]|nr:ABC transporter ATP-binding protein [Acidimicrobiales bacterium]